MLTILASTLHAQEPSITETPKLANSRLTEASGLAASRRYPGLYWAINDSGKPAELFLLDATGADLGTVAVTGAHNRDWEDLASATVDGQHLLVIGDVGDNAGRRKHVQLYVLTEPELVDGRAPRDAAASLLRTIRVRYPDGAADCESVAIDPISRRIWLLTKRSSPPRIYTVALAPADPEAVQLAEPLADLPFANASRLQKAMQAPTAMDLSPDTRSLAVLSYTTTYLWHRTADQTWATALTVAPTALPLTAPQAEALCFSIDARTLFVTGEFRHAILRSALVPRD